MTSDYEAWIISSLSKISKKIFEFGTCSGKTTYLMGLNSCSDASIVSITLNPNDLENIKKKIKIIKFLLEILLMKVCMKNFCFLEKK